MVILLATFIISSCKRDLEVGILNQGAGYYSDNTMPLKDAADFPIGVAISYTPMTADPKYAEVVRRDFDQVVFDYHMKHGAIVQNNGTFNFANTDALIAAAGTMDVFGHTLYWHSNQNATYLKDFAGITVPAATESLANPGFEAGGGTLANWSTFNNQNGSTVAPTSVAGEFRTGTRAMKVFANVGEPANQWKVQVASDLFNTTVGTQYSVSYWVKAASGTGSIRLSTGTSGGGSAQYQGDQPISSSAFTQVIWNFTANSPQTRLVFDMGASLNTYFIDDASVKEVISAPSGAQVAAKVDQALNTWITTIVDRYKGKVKAWDVVNEPFADNPVAVRTNGNTSTTNPDIFVWSNYLGRDAFLKAFNYAKAADPTADLYINDYNLESNPAKLDSLIALVNELKAKGAKIDGIGTQMHIGTSPTGFATGVDNMMKKLAATGLKIRISELDVLTSPSGETSKAIEVDQPAIYRYVVSSYMKHIPKAQQAGITVWGLTDATSWRYNNGAELPLLYDNSYNKKPAYGAVLLGLKGQ